MFAVLCRGMPWQIDTHTTVDMCLQGVVPSAHAQHPMTPLELMSAGFAATLQYVEQSLQEHMECMPWFKGVCVWTR